MLDTLHRIVRKVNAAPDLEQALQIIVSEVKQATASDVCSVYLTDVESRTHILRATEGLRQEAVGKVQLPLHRGLIGLVAERAEPINLDDAPSHPRYLYIVETGEQPYHGFLGVPIIQNRRVLGVLVVRQREPRKFDDAEVTFVFTLAAQLAGAITYAEASGELDGLTGNKRQVKRFLQGQAGSSGLSIGRAVVAYRQADLQAIPDRPADDPVAEEGAFRQAVHEVEQDLIQLKDGLADALPAEDRALFDALLLMLGSDTLVTRTVELIHAGNWAPGALRQSIAEHAEVFEAMEDVYLRERASDVRDLGRRILTHLQGEDTGPVSYPHNTVLVGDEVSAVQLAEVPIDRLAGIVCASGSTSSHVAILARAFGVPAVMGVTDLPVSRMDGRELIVDGYRGRIYVSPEPTVKAEYRKLIQEERALSDELSSLQGLPAETTDGVRVPLYLNTGLVSQIGGFGRQESEGVGLYRTELPFMVRESFPSEDEQEASYRLAMQAFAPRPVVLRTLDVGGDKPLPYFPVNESNPFLGWRGVRISLDHPEIFITQVRAMLRANVGLNNLQIMLPMITTVSEVDELQALIQRAHDELLEEGYPVSMPRIGVMIEVPSAAYLIPQFARRVDFLSIGSNDLTQYLLAVDRNNSRVAELYSDLHPAVLQVIRQIVDTAHEYQRPVSICGELAGNPLAVPLLLAMGVDSLSMSAGSLLKVKWVVRSFSRARARQLLNMALRMDDAEQVRKFLEGALEEMGLGGLVRPGK